MSDSVATTSTVGEELALPGPTVRDWATGEEIVLATAPTERLSEVIDNSATLRGKLKEIEQATSDQLIARLDAEASWTWRGGGFTITAPSPARDTEDFPIDALEAALAKLIAQETITAEAAGKAIKRQITLTVDVPLGANLNELVDAFADWTIERDGVPMRVANASSEATKVASGIKALRKIPAAKKVIDEAAIEKQPPARRVRLTRD